MGRDARADCQGLRFLISDPLSVAEARHAASLACCTLFLSLIVYFSSCSAECILNAYSLIVSIYPACFLSAMLCLIILKASN